MPMIDLSPWFSGGEAGRAAVVENVRTACIKCGFFVITKHGVDPDVIETTWKATRAFFDTDLLNKEAVAMGDSQPYGYSGMEKEVTGQDLEYGKGDLKESFAVALGPAVGRSEAMPADRWPENPRGYAEATTAYYREMEKLSEQLLRILALGLSLPEDFIVAKQRHHWSALRSLNYPHMEKPAAPGQLRIAAHTDYGTITILRADNCPGKSLQVQMMDGSWSDVVFTDDCYVVNLGDLMQRWTNDRYKSTRHRVIPPELPPGSTADTRRISVAFFHNLDRDAICETIPTCVDAEHPALYPPINAWEHLMQRHARSVGQKPLTDCK